MSSIKRAIQRQKQKNNGDFIYKKVLAKKFGCTVPELNKRLTKARKKVKKMEE